MRKIFCGAVVILLVSCGSGDTKSTSGNNTPAGGNSAGSNIISMDTLRIDTSGQSIKK